MYVYVLLFRTKKIFGFTVRKKKGNMVAQITPIYNMIMNNSNKNTRVIKHGKNTWQNTL